MAWAITVQLGRGFGTRKDLRISGGFSSLLKEWLKRLGVRRQQKLKNVWDLQSLIKIG